MRKTIATLYGLVTHATFLAGVGFMAVGLATGMAAGFGTLDGPDAWAANALLAMQFPVLHTLGLSRVGRRLLGHLAPRGLRSDLGTTLFAWLAAVQLLVTFALWSPSGVVWWRPEGAVAWASWAAYGLSWLLLGKSMLDGSLALQTGALGWVAVVHGRSPVFPPMPTRGLFALWRQPIYTSFALILLAAPVWTPDRLLVVLVWGSYCVVGPVFKERRFLAIHGEAFREYQHHVPYWLPWPRSPRG